MSSDITQSHVLLITFYKLIFFQQLNTVTWQIKSFCLSAIALGSMEEWKCSSPHFYFGISCRRMCTELLTIQLTNYQTSQSVVALLLRVWDLRGSRLNFIPATAERIQMLLKYVNAIRAFIKKIEVIELLFICRVLSDHCLYQQEVVSLALFIT